MNRGMGLTAVVALVIVSAPRPAWAQAAMTLSGGPAAYDLSGTGTSAVLGARFEVPILRGVDAQFGSGLFWYTTQGDRSVATLLPELGLLARPVPAVPVYLGVGVGHTLSVRGGQEDDPTLFAALGADIGDRARWAIRPELRVRSVDPWVGTIADFTLGVRRSLGS